MAHGQLCRLGNLKGEFWLGNDYINRLTDPVNKMVRIDMEDNEGDRRFAEYTTFSVADESDDYRVTIDGYRGTAGDELLSLSRPIWYVTGISVFGAMQNESYNVNFRKALAEEQRNVLIIV